MKNPDNGFFAGYLIILKHGDANEGTGISQFDCGLTHPVRMRRLYGNISDLERLLRPHNLPKSEPRIGAKHLLAE